MKLELLFPVRGLTLFKKNIAIIQFPGSNTERETLMACHRVGLSPVEFLWNEPAESLSDFDGFLV